jgi:hypothetical protein
VTTSENAPLPSTGRLRLDMSPHERLARQYAERVYKTLVALEPLYEVPEAIEWLTSSQVGLGNEMPAKLLGLHSGTDAVAASIARVLDGAFS